MKKLVWAVIVLAAVWGLPRLSHPAVDIGKLEPVEVVRLTRIAGGIAVETDSGRMGKGVSLHKAVADLRSGADAEIFLDTADKLILSGNMDGYWEEIFALFRPACQVCRGTAMLELKEAGYYMEIHPSGQTLGELRGGSGELLRLTIEEGRGRYDAG